MEVIIRLGANPSNKIVDWKTDYPYYADDKASEIQGMSDLLQEYDLTIRNVDHFLLYQAATMIMRFKVADNPETPKYIKELPKLNPAITKIIEVGQNGVETCIQDGEGLIRTNYFNRLMNNVMDGYYEALQFYNGEQLKK